LSEEVSETYSPGAETIPPATVLQKEYDPSKGKWIRRLVGRTLLEDSFEFDRSVVDPWIGEGDAGGSSDGDATNAPHKGMKNLKIVTHTDENDAYGAYRLFGLTPSLKILFEGDFQFKSSVNNKYVDFEFIYYDGVNRHETVLRYDPVNNKWQYENSAGAFVDVSSGAQSLRELAYHHIVLTVDFSADKYGYLICDNKIFDLRSIALHATADSTKVSGKFKYKTATATGTFSAEAYLDEIKVVEVATA